MTAPLLFGLAPGSYRPLKDIWGDPASLAQRLPRGSLVVADERVTRLHPRLVRVLRARKTRAVLELRAGERAKTLPVLARVLEAAEALPRNGTLLVVGGGTVGDLGTVAAHLIKRGVSLVHMPTTALAAVDSSVGGKGALHVRAGGWTFKNAAGVFHYPVETWLCPELWNTLEAEHLRQGAIEAWKMFACLDARQWRRGRRQRPGLLAAIRHGRQLKDQVCRRDPYELTDARRVLNFGHTFGHVLETITRFRILHGDAVGLGMLCALDVGRRLGTTPAGVAQEVEEGLVEGPGIPDRRVLSRVMRRVSPAEVAQILAGDKKSGVGGELRMVLLQGLGRPVVTPVPPRIWRGLFGQWRAADRP